MANEEILGAVLGALFIAAILVYCSGLVPANWRTNKMVLGLALFLPVAFLMLAIGSAIPGLLFLFLMMATAIKPTPRKR